MSHKFRNPLDGIIGCALQLQRGHSKCLCLTAVPSSVALSSVVPYLGWSRHRPSVGLRARNPAPMVQYGCRSCGAAISAPCKFQMFQRLRSSGRPSFFQTHHGNDPSGSYSNSSSGRLSQSMVQPRLGHSRKMIEDLSTGAHEVRKLSFGPSSSEQGTQGWAKHSSTDSRLEASCWTSTGR